MRAIFFFCGTVGTRKFMTSSIKWYKVVQKTKSQNSSMSSGACEAVSPDTGGTEHVATGCDLPPEHGGPDPAAAGHRGEGGCHVQ